MTCGKRRSGGVVKCSGDDGFSASSSQQQARSGRFGQRWQRAAVAAAVVRRLGSLVGAGFVVIGGLG